VNCGDCHGVGQADASPHKTHRLSANCRICFRWTRWRRHFSDGRIYSGHPDMPEFIATPEQVDAIIAYIASLQG
jgi:cytochrome c